MALPRQPGMIMEGRARLDFCDTKIVATLLLPSPPSVTLGGAVHRCTSTALPLQFQTLNPHKPMKPKSPTRKSNLKTGNRNGRPALPEEERQSYVRHTRYNEAENALLLANVKRSGMKNVSEYIRSVTLNPKIVPRMSETEMTIARHLSGMSNNFNQLVRLCHQQGLPSMTREVQKYLGIFRELFSKFNED